MVEEILPVASYIEISKIIKFLDLKSVDLNLNNVFVPWVGLYCSGIKEEDLGGPKCRANHYLQEALGVNELPPLSSIEEKKINKKAFCELYSNITNQEYKEDLNITLKEAVSIIAKKTLETLRSQSIIKGENKYFTPSQKEKLSEDGYLIIPSVLSSDEVEHLSELTLLIAKKEDDAGVAYRYGGEEKRLQRIYNLISKHPSYINILEKPIVSEVLDYYFARENLHHKYVLSSFQSNIVHPGGGAQQLHVDGWSFSGVPLPQWATRLNVNFILTDWTKDNGATMLLPGSHKLFRSPSPGELSDSKLLKVVAPKGSLVLWTGHTWHKSGTNNSDSPRFGLFACFAASQLKEVSTEEEHLTVVDEKVRENLSPEMRFMIGLDRGVKKGSLHRVDFSNTEFEYDDYS